MNSKSIRLYSKIVDFLESENLQDYATCFGGPECIPTRNGIPTDFGITYNLSCNQLNKLKEVLGCKDIEFNQGCLPGNHRWTFYALIFEENK